MCDTNGQSGSRPGAGRLIVRTAVVLCAVAGMSSLADAQPLIQGFVEGALTGRVVENELFPHPKIKDQTWPRAEVRLQLRLLGGSDYGRYFVALEGIHDDTRGTTTTDLREAHFTFSPLESIDFKVGRQVATWGTGDLVFVNDLFTKDWVAFFTGLDNAYLKGPQDLLRVTAYAGNWTIDLAASPTFTPDNLPTGERLSVAMPPTIATAGRRSASAAVVVPTGAKPTSAEYFGRVARPVGRAEAAFYAYSGLWPQPLGLTSTGDVFFPHLNALGASWRMPLAAYLVNAEGAVYLSDDDMAGTNPLIPNSLAKGLIGLERPVGADLTVGAQWYVEHTLRFDNEQASMPPGSDIDETRHTATLRLTRFFQDRTVRVSFFGFWGLTEEDGYLRPLISWKQSDPIEIVGGGNIFFSDRPGTMFGRFDNNDNLYTRLRYSF